MQPRGVSADGRTIVGYGRDASGNDAMWIASLDPLPEQVQPASFSITTGTLNSGNLTYTNADEGDKLVANAFTSARTNLVINFTGTTSVATPTRIDILVKNAATSTVPAVETVYAYNYLTSTYTQLAIRNVSSSQTWSTVSITSSPASYVNGSGEVKLQLKYSAGAVPNYTVSYDAVRWIVHE
jgi:hypothetical protein